MTTSTVDTKLTHENIRLLLLETAVTFDNDGPYWKFYEHGEFLRTFCTMACDFIGKMYPADITVKDICGGNGTLGLGLALHSITNYTLMDYNPTYLKWAQHLYTHFEVPLHARKFNVLHNAEEPHDADVVTLLGWENFDIHFAEAFKVARAHLKSNGTFLFTFQDDDIVRSSDWEEYFRNHHQGWDRIQKPKHGYYTARYTEIETWLAQAGMAPLWKAPSHTLERYKSPRGVHYPQFLVMARPVESHAKGTTYSVSIQEKSAAALHEASTTPPRDEHLPLSEYRALLQQLQERSDIRFTHMREFAQATPRGKEKLIALRHDVDSNIHLAARAVEVETALGLSGVYFILASASDYYGYFDGARRQFTRYSGLADILRDMQARGAEIGWHNDQFGVLLHWGLDPALFLRTELDYWREQGLDIKGTAAHCSLTAFGGVSNFEYFHGQTIHNRQWGHHNKRTLIPVGRHMLNEFGLEYSAECIVQATTTFRDNILGDTYRAEAGTLEMLHCDLTGRFIFYRGSWVTQSYPSVTAQYSTTELAAHIASAGAPAKIILDVHPEHFVDDIQAPS